MSYTICTIICTEVEISLHNETNDKDDNHQEKYLESNNLTFITNKSS